MGAERAERRQPARPVTVWRNGALIQPERALEPSQRRLWARLLWAWARVEREEFARRSARDADIVAAQLGARAYGPSRGSGARDKGRVERLALKGVGE